MALGDKERAEQLIVSSSSDTVKYEENNTRQISLAKNKKDGESVGFLEVPKYINKEVEKALDIKVDELVRSRKDLPDVVLRSIYEEALDTIASQSIEIEDLETNVNDLTADLIAMTADRDTQRELKISAELSLSELENLYISLSDQFKDTVIELQKAVERSTQEAIERVSLEARFEAIKAQLQASLLAIQALNAQVENVIATNYMNSSIQDEVGDFAMKVPVGNVGMPTKPGLYFDWDYGSYKRPNGQELVFYNFGTTPKTVQCSKSNTQRPDNATRTYIPASFNIPAGTEWNDDLGKCGKPGATTLTIGVKRPGGWKESDSSGWRKNQYIDLKFTDQAGNQLEHKVTYTRDWKVKNYAENNPGPTGFTIDYGTDSSMD